MKVVLPFTGVTIRPAAVFSKFGSDRIGYPVEFEREALVLETDNSFIRLFK